MSSEQFIQGIIGGLAIEEMRLDVEEAVVGLRVGQPFAGFHDEAGQPLDTDVAIAAPEAQFAFSEVKLGIIPAVISPFVLPRIGEHARRYFLTGERFDAAIADA